MADRPTCGQGLAEHSSLPAKLGELTASVAGILEGHLRALDLGDERSSRERDVYLRLVEQHRRTAGELAATGREMAGQRDLPMGAHDLTVMLSSEAVAVFERFVQAERDLLALLQERLRQDEQLLAGMRQGG
ncbi:MAG TPA: hypothetical protein VF880_19150 [Actinomycetes bacterium]|jgi:hypothetical protein